MEIKMTDLDTTWNEATRGPRMSEATGRVIFKYQMPVQESFIMDLPKGAEIIRVQDQDGMFWMWTIVNTSAPMEKRCFKAFKTGAKMPDGMELKYIGFCAIFVQMELGLYIFEDVEGTTALNRILERFKVDDSRPENHRPTIREIIQKTAMDKNMSVMDVKLSDIHPSYFRGLPTPDIEDPWQRHSKEFNQTRLDIEEARMEEEEE